MQWGHLDANPLTGVKKAKEDRNRAIRALTPQEEADIADVFKARRDKAQEQRFQNARAGQRTRPLPMYLDFLEPAFRLSLETGLRRGELIALIWADIDLAQGTLTVQGAGAKSSQTRTIPLMEKTLVMLARWKTESGGTGRVFPGVTANTLKYRWTALLKAAKVKPLRWHDLRHSYASRLIMAGAPLPTVQRLMGHADIKTTARYLHANSDDLKRAVGLLNAPSNIVPMREASVADK